MPVHIKIPTGLRFIDSDNIGITPEWFKSSRHYVKTSTGWRRSYQVWVKTGASTWTRGFVNDEVLPTLPTVVEVGYHPKDKKVLIRIAVPNEPDINRTVLKYSPTAYPLNALDSANMQPWSIKQVTPGGSYVYEFTVAYTGRTYYVSIWTVDNQDRASIRRRIEVMVPNPSEPAPPPPTTPVVKSATYNATESGSWNLSGMNVPNWSSTLGSTVGQGGSYNHRGVWFYSGKINTALKNAKKIRRMTLKVTRINSSHGVSTAANVWLSPCLQVSKSSGKPFGVTALHYKAATLGRGQTKTIEIPSTYYQGFLNGTYKSFCIWAGDPTSYSSPDYILCHGAGTTSGQVYVEWEE